MIVIGGILFLAIGLALVVFCVITGEEALASRQWPTTRGEITSFELRQSSGVDGDALYGVRVRYRFTVDGVERIGMRAYFGDYFLFVPAPSAGGPRRRMSYRVGEIVDVSYDPANPNESVLQPGVSSSLLYVFFIGVAFAAIAITLGFLSCAPRVNPTPAAFVGRVLEEVGTVWHAAPPQVHLDERTAPVTLLRFERSGRFSMINATVIEQRGQYSIPDGDPIQVSTGTWKSSGRNVTLEYHTVNRTFRVEPADEKTKTAGAAIDSRGDAIVFRGRRFETSHVRAAEYDRVVNADNTP